ncbi:MAG TPA: hypothetical protein VFZ23_13730 [Pyrinomonadaceae bacterium]
MKSTSGILVALFVFAYSISAQSITNDTVRERIRSAQAGKSIELIFDETGRTTKLMAVSEGFAKDEVGSAGLLAMSFALGCIYPGDSLAKSPETYLFTFWVLTKKPRFGENHTMTAALKEEMLVVGSARYVAKPREQMEYLNFEISRDHLAKIASQSDVRFMLGDETFTFTGSQLKLIASVLAITEVSDQR